ncbi:MAG: sigma-54-dependent Fis family transcriptional regulator [Xanthomonadales bacterium]|nr:sigma-54-dependent Fis family transcriptional regulator [Xanthomonadales bacterium]
MTESKSRKPSPIILVVDDQEDVRQALSVLLSGEGYGVLTAESPAAALEAMNQKRFGLVLFDMNYSRDTTSGAEGLALLESLLEVDDSVPMVAMTAWGSIELAVEALKRGAVDFLEKPWDNNRLLTIVKTQLERMAALERAERLSRAAELEQRSRVAEGIVAESSGMRNLLDMAGRVAASDASILITGDNGVGKGMLAEQIHRWSSVADQVFVSVNMGSIPESLFEAEMFGHARGAFTDAVEARAGRFELADGGTLFLDEVGNLPVAQQAKLLRVLETGQFERVGENRTRKSSVRLIAATNADLPGMVERGEFRRDLYFRLNTIELDIPPLHQRPDDILPLAERFLARNNRKYKRRASFSAEARRALQAHAWPGNVRELAHAVERAVLLCGEAPIEPGNLMLQPAAGREPAPDLVQPLEEIERQAIEQALARFDDDVNQAAEALGLSRSAMYRRLEKYRIRGDDAELT